MEKSEKAKKLRELRKYGKKVSVDCSNRTLELVSVSTVSQLFCYFFFFFFFCTVHQVQVEVLQKRQKEKKAMMSAVKKYQKGAIVLGDLVTFVYTHLSLSTYIFIC